MEELVVKNRFGPGWSIWSLSAIVGLWATSCTQSAESRPSTASKMGAVTIVSEQRPNPVVRSEKGVVSDQGTHVLRVDRPAEVTAKTDNAVTVTLVPKKEWKLNQDFPTRLRVQAPEGVTLEKSAFTAKDAAEFGEKKARFIVSFSSAPGAKRFKAEMKFALCTDATCDPKKETIGWVIHVK